MLQDRSLPLVRSATDPAQAKAARRIERERDELLRADIVSVMGTPAGRRLLGRIVRAYKVNESVYDNVAMKMAWNEGRRNAGLELMADLLAAAPEQFDLMQHEHRLALGREQAELTASHSKPRSEGEEDRGE